MGQLEYNLEMKDWDGRSNVALFEGVGKQYLIEMGRYI